MLQFIIRTIFLSVFFFALGAEEAEVIKRVQAYLLIGDVESAKSEAAFGTAAFAASRKLKEAEIEVLARAGDEKKMIHCWRSYAASYPDAFKKTDLLETMAWGVIDKGFWASSPMTRAIALVAANLSQTSKGICLLDKGTRDTNSAIRALSLELSMQNRDILLQERVLEVLEDDKSWNARMAALKAAGAMRIKKAKETLRKFITSPSATDEERALAVRSLVMILDASSKQDVARLARSRREGLRLLACEIVAVFQQHGDLELIVPLLQDHSSQIRRAALQVIGILRDPEIKGIKTTAFVHPMLKDPDTETAIIASWVLMLFKHPEGQRAMNRFLHDDSQEVRCFAAAALRSAGKYGRPLIERAFNETRDGYVKLNLAIGLIGQRLLKEEACQAIYTELMENKERWMWLEEGVFRSIAPSTLFHREDIPQFPEVVNQLVRLEMLQLLAFLDHPRVLSAMKDFLKQRTFGMTGVVAALMLTEGEEESLGVIRQLLNDPDDKIRAQAALILALWGRDDGALKELETVYDTSGRLVKEKVLESMGSIGSHRSLPFLVARLSEPHQHLRMIAAAAIIQCVNH